MYQEKSPLAKRATSRPFVWGVVGAGVIARQFAHDVERLAGGRIGAVCARSEESAQRFMTETGTAKAYSNLASMVKDAAIDAVYLATPSHMHAPQALEALSAGKPVLVEKPLATSSRDAARILELARTKRRFAMEALWTRFLPAVSAFRDLLLAGAIGEIEHIEAELAYKKTEAADSRFFDPALGGGAALDLGVYPLSLAVMILGTPERFSGGWWAASSGVDRRCDISLTFAGATASLSCGFDRDGANAFTVFGSRGALRIEAPFLKAQRLTLFEGRMRDLPLLGARAPAGGVAGKMLARLPLPGRGVQNYRFDGNGLQFEAEAVAHAVRSGDMQSDVMPLRDSVTVLEIIETVLAQHPQPM